MNRARPELWEPRGGNDPWPPGALLRLGGGDPPLGLVRGAFSQRRLATVNEGCLP